MAESVNDGMVESWVLSLHSKRPRTVEHYVDELRRFESWLVDHCRPEAAPGDLLAVGRRDAESWIVDQRDRGLSPATIRNRYIALRSFYGWATEEEEIRENPLLKVKVDKPEPPPPDVVNDADIKALLKVCSGAGFQERRDYAIVRTLLATGLRVSELCDLTLEDVDLPNRLIYVRDGKGGMARVVRCDAATAAAIDRYRRVRAKHRFASMPDLWIGHRGAMTRKGVPSMLNKRCLEAGIAHVHPHQLRHTWAHRFHMRGGQEGDLMRLGGWRDSKVMRRYGEARAVDRALAAYDDIDPMAGL